MTHVDSYVKWVNMSHVTQEWVVSPNTYKNESCLAYEWVMSRDRNHFPWQDSCWLISEISQHESSHKNKLCRRKHIEMSRALCMIKSFPTYRYVMSHMWNESCLMRLICEIISHIWNNFTHLKSFHICVQNRVSYDSCVK